MEQTERPKAENPREAIIARLEPLFKENPDIQELRSEIHRRLGWIVFISGRWQGKGEEVSAEKIIGNFNIKGREARTAWERIKHQVSKVVTEVMNENPLAPEKPEEAEVSDTTAWLNKNNVKKLVERLGMDFNAFVRDKDGMACLRLWADKIKKERVEEKPAAGISFREIYDTMMERIFRKGKKEAVEEKVSKEAAVELCKFLLSRRYGCEENEIDFSNPSWQEKLVQFAGAEKLWIFTHRSKLEKYTDGKVTLYQCLQPYLSNMDKVNSQEHFRKAFVVFCKEYLGFDYDAVFTSLQRAKTRRLQGKYAAKKRQEKPAHHISKEALLDKETLKEAIKQAFGLRNHNFRTAKDILFSTSLDKIVSRGIVIRGRRVRFEVLLEARKNERYYTFGKVWRHILIDVCGFKEEEVPRIRWGPDYHGRLELQRKAFMLAFDFNGNIDFRDPKILQVLENPSAAIFTKPLDVDPDLERITLANICCALWRSKFRQSSTAFYYSLKKGIPIVSKEIYEILVHAVTGKRISSNITDPSVKII